MECHLSLTEFNVQDGLIVIKHAPSVSRVSHSLMCQLLTSWVVLVDRGRGVCVRANLLDHGDVPGHEAGEDSLWCPGLRRASVMLGGPLQGYDNS